MIEVWTDQHAQVASLSADLIEALVKHYFDGLALGSAFRAQVDRKPPAELPSRRPRQTSVPFTDEQRAAFKARRSKRKA